MGSNDECVSSPQHTCAGATVGDGSDNEDNDQASLSTSENDYGDNDGDGDSSSRGGTVLELLAQRDALQRCPFMKRANVAGCFAFVHHVHERETEENQLEKEKRNV